MWKREEVGDLGGGCQGRDNIELDESKSSGEERDQSVSFWVLPLVLLLAGPAILSSVSPSLKQELLSKNVLPALGVLESLLSLALGAFPRSMSVCVFSQG